jgi:DNA-binding beta-propeller fold protein YncE
MRRPLCRVLPSSTRPVNQRRYPGNRHDDAVRRLVMALGGAVLLAGLWPGLGGAAAVSSVVSRGLSAPSGIAVDGQGNLLIADTDDCRVLVDPAHSGEMYGLHVTAHHIDTVAGNRCGSKDGLTYPTGVAVDGRDDLFIAEATGQRVMELRAESRTPVPFAGTGVAGDGDSGGPATSSPLNEPTGVAVDPQGDVFIADTDNCRVAMVPASSETFEGQAMVKGHLYDVAGDGTCGSAGRGGPGPLAQVWDPVALAVDHAGDVFIADNGDQSVLELAAHAGNFYGTAIGAGDLQTIVGMGMYGPYLLDGLSATSIASELNDPEGLAVSGTGVLYITDGDMQCIRVVPNSTSSIFGRTMSGGNLYTLAGALPVTEKGQPAGDGTKWVLTQMEVPIGIAVSPSGAVYFSERDQNLVRVIR